MTAPITIFIDGACPLCRREGRALERLDKGRGRIRLVDITDPEFDAARHGRTPAEFDARIHALTPEGEMVEGLEVFRRVYRALGLGWLWAPTAWPLLRPVCDAFYRWFARNRHRLTGRSCDNGACDSGARAPKR